MKPRLLVFGRQQGAPYHPLGAVAAVVVSIFEARYEVEVTDDPARLTQLDGLALLVGLDDRWTEDLGQLPLAGVERWVRAGGALLLLHNGLCWARDPRWRRLVGASFTGHDSARTLAFRGELGPAFTLFEEPYRFSLAAFSGRTLLATYHDEGRDWPAAWSVARGRGRIGYALPGHHAEAYAEPAYRAWLVELATRLEGPR